MSRTSLLRQFSHYLGANAIMAIVGVIALPVYSELLTPAEYGIFAVFTSTVALLTALLPLNMHSAVSRYYYEETSDFDAFFGTIALLCFGIFALAGGATVFAAEPLSELVALPVAVVPFLVAVTAVRVLQSFHDQIYTARMESRPVSIVHVARVVLEFAVAVVIIHQLTEDEFFGPIWAQLLVGIGLTILFVVRLAPFFEFTFQKKHLRYAVLFSIPLIPYQLGSMILSIFDRLMINHYLGSSDAGQYSMSYNIAMLLSLFTTAIFQAWTPYYFRHMNDENYDQHDIEIVRICRLILIAGLGLSVLGPEMASWILDERYHPGLVLVPVVAGAYVAFGLTQMYVRHIGYAKKTYYSSLVIGAAAVVNVVLNALLLPIHGYVVAAYTTLAAYLVMGVIAWVVNRFLISTHSTPLRLWLGPALLFCAALATGLGVEYLFEGRWLVFGLRVAVVALAIPLIAGRDLVSEAVGRLGGTRG